MSRGSNWNPFLFFALALPFLFVIAVVLIVSWGVGQRDECASAGGEMVRGTCIDREHIIDIKETK